MTLPKVQSYGPSKTLIACLLLCMAATVILARVFLLSIGLRSDGTALDYSMTSDNDVSFSARGGESYTRLAWRRRAEDSGEPPKLTVYLPDGELDGEHLASFDRLKIEGWSAEPAGHDVYMSHPGGIVFCTFHNKVVQRIEVVLLQIGIKKKLKTVNVSVWGKVLV